MMLTRETSGLVIEVDEKGRQRLWFHGRVVPATVEIRHISGGDRDRALGGLVTISIPARFITFRNKPAEGRPA